MVEVSEPKAERCEWNRVGCSGPGAGDPAQLISAAAEQQIRAMRRSS
jgi:hypothetical protein